MKNGILALLLVFATTLSVSAQIKPSKKKTTTEQPTESEKTDTDTSIKKKTSSKKTDQYFDESGGFKHRLWYGSSFNLGFSGANGSSLFSIGLTPMVGYKIIGGLSAGPRVGITYTSYKSYDTKNEISTVGLIDYSFGAFTRYKAFKNFFAQAEYEYQSQQFAGGDNYGRIELDAAGKPLKSRISRSMRRWR